MPTINDRSYRRITTARFFFTPKGSTKNKDVGDISIWQMKPDIKRTPRMDTEKGFRQKTAEYITEVSYQFEFTVNEITIAMLEFMELGQIGADVVQAAATDLTASFTAAFEEGFFLNATGTTIKSVKNGAGTVTYARDVDYQADDDSGYIKVIKGGAITEGQAILVTYDTSAQTRRVINSLRSDKIFTEGSFRLFIYDQFDGKQLQDISGKCQVFVTDWGTSDGSKIQEVKLSALITSSTKSTLRA